MKMVSKCRVESEYLYFFFKFELRTKKNSGYVNLYWTFISVFKFFSKFMQELIAYSLVSIVKKHVQAMKVWKEGMGEIRH